MEAFFGFLAIPLIGIISPIWLSFEEDIKATNKALLFLLLPIGETLFLILAIVEFWGKNAKLRIFFAIIANLLDGYCWIISYFDVSFCRRDKFKNEARYQINCLINFEFYCCLGNCIFLKKLINFNCRVGDALKDYMRLKPLFRSRSESERIPIRICVECNTHSTKLS